jgi:hypothetical protein
VDLIKIPAGSETRLHKMILNLVSELYFVA